MPEVVGIPGRSEIRIHWGNSAVDTEGCILVGATQRPDWIGASRAAFADLYGKLLQAKISGEVIKLTVSPNAFTNQEAVREAAADEK